MTEIEELRLRLTDLEAQVFAMEANSDPLSNVIIGAVIGGLIALGIQVLVLWANDLIKSKETRERRQALGQSVLIKMIKIFSNLEHFNRHMIEMLERENELQGEPWQATLPLANHPEKITFTNDEMSMLLSLKVDDFFNKIISIDAIHNSTIDLFLTFSDRWHDLTSKLPTKQMEGMVGTTVLDQEQTQLLRPKMLMLNQLIVDIRQRCDQDSKEAFELLQELRTVLNEKLDLKYEVDLKA